MSDKKKEKIGEYYEPGVWGAWLWSTKKKITQKKLDNLTGFPNEECEAKLITLTGGKFKESEFEDIVKKLTEYGRRQKAKNMVVTIANGKKWIIIRSVK